MTAPKRPDRDRYECDTRCTVDTDMTETDQSRMDRPDAVILGTPFRKDNYPLETSF